MDPVEHTPTEPADYAALSAIYGTLLAGTALSARGPSRDRVSELPALAAASFALSKLVVHEKVESWMRRPFVDERRGKPKGRRLRYAVGELLHVHALHRCVERARPGRPAGPFPGRRPDRLGRARRLSG